jgi:predicted PurR-regulated permease PerM
MKDPPQDKTVVRFEIAPRTIVLILFTVAGVWLLIQLWVVVLLVLVALVFAGTLNPVVEWMERRGLGRFLALLALLVGLVVLASLMVFLTVPPLLEQLTQIVRDAPARREQLIALLGSQSITAPFAHLVQNAGLDQTFARVESYLLGYSSRAAKVVGYFAFTFVLAFYVLADGKRTQGALYSVVPRAYHMRLARIIHNLETIVGGYMRGQIITCTSIGLFTFVVLTVFGVPNALSLALFAALVDVVPFVGVIVAGFLAVLSALPRGLPVTAAVLGLMLVYMEFESRILVPRVYWHVLRLSPTTVILALLVGGTLLGVMGALLALPIAAGLQMILEELRVEMPGDDSDDRTVRARDAKAEATYERMSAGSTAPEAGLIARELAHDIREVDAVRKAKDARESAAVAVAAAEKAEAIAKDETKPDKGTADGKKP